jgi:hypothetical protein
MARRYRDGTRKLFSHVIPKPCQTADHDALRQNAIACDITMICGKARPIMMFHSSAIAPAPPRRARGLNRQEGAQMYFFGAILE